MSTLKPYFLTLGVAVAIAAVALLTMDLPPSLDDAPPGGVRVPDDFCDQWFAGGAEVPDFAEKCDSSVEPSLAKAAAMAVRRFSTPDNRWFLASIPPAWADRPRRQALVILHGSAGNTESALCEAEKMRTLHNLALVAIPHIEASRESRAHPDDPGPADELIASVLQVLKPACPGTTDYFLYGVSRGARLAISLAAMDLARPDGPRFAGYLLDTAPWFDKGFTMPPTLEKLLAERGNRTFARGRFWLYCGDRNEKMCSRVSDTADRLKQYGGQVDAVVRDPQGVHGLFHSHTPVVPGPAAQALLAYLESFAPDLSRVPAGATK